MPTKTTTKKSSSKTKTSTKTSKRSGGSTKALSNHVAIILDRSGSMVGIRDATISAFNEQVTAIQNSSKGQKTRVSLVTFSTTVDDPTIWEQESSRLSPLTSADYNPDGNTALYDAVGTTIKRLSEVSDAGDKNTSFLVVIVTDGEENNSKNWNSEAVSTIIKEKTKTNRWTFSYLGANVDLSKVAKTMSIPTGNVRGFTASKAGVGAASALNASATMSYFAARNMGATSTNTLYRDVDGGSGDPTTGSSRKSKTSN